LNHQHWYEPVILEDPRRPRNFVGQMNLPDGTSQVVWAELTHHEQTPSPISCKLRYRKPIPSRFIFPYKDLTISLQPPFKGFLRLHQIHGGIFGEDEAAFTLGRYDLLDKDSMIPAHSEVYCTAALTSRGLLPPTVGRIVNRDGTIDRAGRERQSIRWSSRGNDHSFTLSHEPTQVIIGRSRGLLLLERPHIELKFRPESPTALSAILEEAVESFVLPLLLFSFFSRETIEVFDLLLVIQPNSGDSLYIEARRRTDAVPPEPADRDERSLYSEEHLAGGAFEASLAALEATDHLSELSRAIRYHLASYRSRYCQELCMRP
jgi:hypothetical protein